MGLIVLFGTIHGSHYTISTNIYLDLEYFQQKVFFFFFFFLNFLWEDISSLINQNLRRLHPEYTWTQ